jgi:hypothetical protein
LGFTYDSYDYLAAATSFREDLNFLNADNSPYFIHAPFFPLWMSFLGNDPVFAVRIIHIVLFIISMLIIDKLLHETISIHALRVTAFLLISMAVGLHMVHNFIWTEPTFLVFFALHNLALVIYFRQEKPSLVFLMALLAFFMGITRNAALFIILPTGFSLWYFSSANKVRSGVMYTVIGLSGFLIWNFYALVFVNKLSTFQEGGSLYQDFSQSLWVYPDVMSKWFLPVAIPRTLRISLFLIGLIAIFYFSWRILSLRAPKVFMIQSVAYWACLVPIIVVENSEAEKLLAIVYPFFIMSILALLDKKWVLWPKTYRKMIMICLLGWLIYVSVRTIKNSVMWHRNNCNREIGCSISREDSMV